MPMVTLPAHFDGKRICLDEPFDLETDTKLIVTVLQKQEPDNEHKSWALLSGRRLEEAYGENEPDYSSGLLKEGNSNYEAG